MHASDVSQRGEPAIGRKAEIVYVGKFHRQLLDGEAGHEHVDDGIGFTRRERKTQAQQDRSDGKTHGD